MGLTARRRIKGFFVKLLKLLMRAFVLLVLVFSSVGLSAQTVKIAGKVISSRTGEPLVGATVSTNTPKRQGFTDQAGRYTLSGLPAGTYTITITYTGYDTKEVSEITVTNADVTDVNISLDPKQSNLDAVVVRSKARAETQSTLLIAQKNSAVVSDGISAELIKRTPDRNTSDVLKRVSGVSIQDNRFVVVRGLNDRYNAAYLNGAPLPSTENDRKAFAFDIFPANMLENLVIVKTASPDLPGEFAGGIININTNSIPTKNFTSVTVGTGMNTITTFKDGSTYDGGKTDWIGLSDSRRDVPNGIPATSGYPTNTAQRGVLAKLYTDNTWGINTRTVLPNLNFQISNGLNIQRKGSEFFGMLLSLTYNKSFTFAGGELNNYEYNRADPSAPPLQRGALDDASHSEATLAGLVANFSVKLNANNRIGFKNLFSINSEDRVISRLGQPDISGDPEFTVLGTALWYTTNFIRSSQLSGDHNLSRAKIKVNWLLSNSTVRRKIPDLRQMGYGQSGAGSDFVAALPSATVSADNAGTRFYSQTDETISSAKVDLVRNFDAGKTKTQVKLGGYFQYRDREFDARLLGFASYRSPQGFESSLLILPQERIFDPANLGLLQSGRGGFLLLDGTSPTFAYDAQSTLVAAYMMGDTRLGKKWRAIYGVRYEYFIQKLGSFVNFTDRIQVNTKKPDFLPSVNLVYSINNKQNLRACYSRTLNRPEFRELAPFAFFDFSNRIVVGGNPNLLRASIDNFDLRYEFYPGKGQLISMSAFYKSFNNPIELTSDPNNFNSTAYQNAINGKSYGGELEFRTLLGTLFGTTESVIWNRFTLSANAAFIWSSVKEAPFAGIVKGVEDRTLQGQSPYLFNMALSYLDNDHGWSANLSANRVGQRIFIVGSVNEPDTWEQGRTVMDLQLTKNLVKDKLELKFNARDLLRQQQVFFLDLDENDKYNKGSDNIFQARTFGSVLSISATYKF
jgi:outer membrane receptor protein involved in Fe transport